MAVTKIRTKIAGWAYQAKNCYQQHTGHSKIEMAHPETKLCPTRLYKKPYPTSHTEFINRRIFLPGQTI